MSDTKPKLVIPLILAGGKGSRLWPMSSDTTPKQFCALDGASSFFRSTVKRVSDRSLYEPPMVITSHDHHAIVARELEAIGANDVRIILEPEGRDTAPAIVIAALLARASLPKDREGYLLVLPSDHVLKRPSAFHMAVQAALETPNSDQILWALGVPPLSPETSFGYLKLGAAVGKSTYKVQKFVEKPDESRARELIASGRCVWNSGMFLFPVSLLLEEIKVHFPQMLAACNRAALDAEIGTGYVRPGQMAWTTLTSISIDHALMERTQRAGVVLMDPGWSDLGNWQTWWSASPKDADANAAIGPVTTHQCTNTMVHSEGPVVAALGVNDIAIIANKDAVLVTSLALARDLKEMTQDISNLSPVPVQTPTFEERPWGRFDCLQNGGTYQVKLITVKPGGTLSLQYHHHRSEHWTIVQGTADIRVGNEERQLGPNQSVYIPKEAIHRLANSGSETVKLIEVQVGEYLGEDDIIRLEDDYGRQSPEAGHVPARRCSQPATEFTQK